MATTAPTVDVDSGGHDSVPPQRPLLRRVHRHIPKGVWYGLGALGLAIVVVLIQLAFYMRRAEPRDARAIVQREITTNVLQPGERVVHSVPVFRRSPADYFRATRGLLVLTDRRLVYLGAPPRDITGASDAPPTFDQREFRFDAAAPMQPCEPIHSPPLQDNDADQVDHQADNQEKTKRKAPWLFTIEQAERMQRAEESTVRA